MLFQTEIIGEGSFSQSTVGLMKKTPCREFPPQAKTKVACHSSFTFLKK